MIEINASVQKGNFDYTKFIKDYFVGEGSGTPDPFGEELVDLGHRSESAVEAVVGVGVGQFLQDPGRAS